MNNEYENKRVTNSKTENVLLTNEEERGYKSVRAGIFFSETSPVRLAPYSTSNIFKLGGAGFWSFFPN